MPIEIERKFLLKPHVVNSNPGLRKKMVEARKTAKHIKQYYFSGSPRSSQRLSITEYADGCRPQDAVLAIKFDMAKGSMSRYEYEIPLSIEEAIKVAAEGGIEPIHKTRYLVSGILEDEIWEIDEIVLSASEVNTWGFNTMYLVEFEHKDEDRVKNVSLPDWIEAELEVTDDPVFRMASIAKAGGMDNALRMYKEKTRINDLDVIIHFMITAHTKLCTKDLYRRFDGQTPFFVHPLGMFTMILNDDKLPYTLRRNAAIVALLHDTLEDTRVLKEVIKTNLMSANLNEIEVETIIHYIEKLTFKSSAESRNAHMTRTEAAFPIEVLVRAADVADNLQTLSAFKKSTLIENIAYMEVLLQELSAIYPDNTHESGTLFIYLRATIEKVERYCFA
jgi:CYTH domain-containing protein